MKYNEIEEFIKSKDSICLNRGMTNTNEYSLRLRTNNNA